MRELIYHAAGELTWNHRDDLRVAADHEAVVRPIAATTCDVDQVVLRGLTPFRGPFAIGHECVAEIVEVGDAVTERRVGDIVSVPYHRLCGQCDPCLAGVSLHCERMPVLPVYGFPGNEEWGGMFSDQLRVPYADHALVPIPANVDPIAAASLGDNLSNAWSITVPHLRAKPDARVLVVGAGGTGLYATQWAIAHDARSVTYVDTSEQRLARAEAFGASSRPWKTGMRSRDRYDLIIHAAGEPDSLRFCLEAAAPEAICENLAIFFEPVELPLFNMHLSGVHLHSGFFHARPFMPEVLDALADRTIDPRLVETEVVPFDDAPTALVDPTYKPILTRPPLGTATATSAERHQENSP